MSNFFMALSELSEEGNLMCVCAARNVAETSKREKIRHYPHPTSSVNLIIHSNRENE